VVCAFTGSFLGYPLKNVSDRLPPLVFPFHPTAPSVRKAPKFRLIHRPPAIYSAGRLTYRFVNTHTASADREGNLLVEYLVFDPRHYFSKDFAIRKAFDKEEIKVWIHFTLYSYTIYCTHTLYTLFTGLDRALARGGSHHRTAY
jgi:hypothetical protein